MILEPAPIYPSVHASIVLKPLWYKFTAEHSKNLHEPYTTPGALLWYTPKTAARARWAGVQAGRC